MLNIRHINHTRDIQILTDPSPKMSVIESSKSHNHRRKRRFSTMAANISKAIHYRHTVVCVVRHHDDTVVNCMEIDIHTLFRRQNQEHICLLPLDAI